MQKNNVWFKEDERKKRRKRRVQRRAHGEPPSLPSTSVPPPEEESDSDDEDIIVHLESGEHGEQSTSHVHSEDCEHAKVVAQELAADKGARVVAAATSAVRGSSVLLRTKKRDAAEKRRELRNDPRTKHVLPAPKLKKHWYSGSLDLQDGSGTVSARYADGLSTEACFSTLASNKQSAFRLDALRAYDVKQQGGPVLHVIWEPDCNVDDFTSSIVADELGAARPGGAAVWIDAGGDEDEESGWHATACATALGGTNSGSNPYAPLMLVNSKPMMYSSVLALRAVLERFPAEMPKVVSLSAESVWYDLSEQDDQEAVRYEMKLMDDEFADMAVDLNVLLLASAGNDNLDLCEGGRAAPKDREDISQTLSWPSTPLINSVEDTPYFLVGATVSVPGEGNRGKASFSNYGNCVGLIMHGGPYCLPYQAGDPAGSYLPVRGTSFSCPFAAGMAGLMWGADITQSVSALRAALLSASTGHTTSNWPVLGAPGFLELPASLVKKVDGSDTSLVSTNASFTYGVSSVFGTATILAGGASNNNSSVSTATTEEDSESTERSAVRLQLVQRLGLLVGLTLVGIALILVMGSGLSRSRASGIKVN